jgi:hypothetical protein
MKGMGEQDRSTGAMKRQVTFRAQALNCGSKSAHMAMTVASSYRLLFIFMDTAFRPGDDAVSAVHLYFCRKPATVDWRLCHRQLSPNTKNRVKQRGEARCIG